MRKTARTPGRFNIGRPRRSLRRGMDAVVRVRPLFFTEPGARRALLNRGAHK